LLAHGVDERPALQTLQIAIRGGPENLDIVKQLIATNIRLLSPAFEYTTAIEDPLRKTPILEVLLKMGVGQDALDKALAAETRHAVSNKDTTSTKMLMEKGASVSHNDGEALSVAVTSRDSSLTTILLSGKQQPSPANVKKAFIALFAPRSHSGPTFIDDDLYKVAQQLLACNVDPPAIDMALRVALSNPKSSHYEPLIDMLLQYNANVNTSDGVCFVFAAQKHHTVFETSRRTSCQVNQVVLRTWMFSRCVGSQLLWPPQHPSSDPSNARIPAM
jgi:hypothetical protein